MHIPEGFASVTPYIFAAHAEDYVRFLEAAFGAAVTSRSVTSGGRLANCQLRIGGAMVMVSEASREFPPSLASFYLYVADAVAAMTIAEAAGAERIMDVADMPYGDRQGGIRDPSGNIWWISQRLTSDGYA